MMKAKLNLGAGGYTLPGFLSIDSDSTTHPDLCATVPPIPFADGDVAEIYMGHVLEHLTSEDGFRLLQECARVLEPGGVLGVVVPDTRAIMRRWLDGPPTSIEVPPGVPWDLADLDQVCAVFLYSTVQPSRHRWSYDYGTLCRAMHAAGFRDLTPIDRFEDPRIPVHVWYATGVQGVTPHV